MGAYRLVRKLATGGMAEVFLGKVVGLDGFEKPVAVKRILPHLGEDPIFVSLFLQEAKLTVALQHANVVQVFDLGALRGQYYMVLEFVDGENLRSLLTSALKYNVQVGLREACYITRQVAEGLAYAHERKDGAARPLNIVHRDVNPTNVMISRAGEVKLADFGIAKATTSQSHTQAGTIKAKTGYMAPEQATGAEPDQRGDVFLLGLLLYELLAGRKLFQETDIIRSIRQVAAFDVANLPYVVGVPPPLWNILLKALAQEPQARCPSAREFSNLISGFLFDNRLRVGDQEIGALFAKAFPGWRSALEAMGTEAVGEEIRLSSPQAAPGRPRSESTPSPSTPTPLARIGTVRLPTAPPGAEPPARRGTTGEHQIADGRRTSGEFEVPLGLSGEPAQSAIKLDRRAQQVVLSLLGAGKLTQDRLPEVASRCAASGTGFLVELVACGAVSESDLMEAQAEVLRVSYISDKKLESMAVPKEALSLVQAAQAQRLGAVPLAVRGGQLFCATDDPSNLNTLDELKFISGKPVVAILATPTGLGIALRRFYNVSGRSTPPNVPAWSQSSYGMMELEVSEDGGLTHPSESGLQSPAPSPKPIAPAPIAPIAAPSLPPLPTVTGLPEIDPNASPQTLTPLPVAMRLPETPAPVAAPTAVVPRRAVTLVPERTPAPVKAPTPLPPPPTRLAAVHERLLAGLFSLVGGPLTSAPASMNLAQRLAERLGASEAERERVGVAAAVLAVAGRLENDNQFATPSLATVRALLGPAYNDVADLIAPVTGTASPSGPGAAGLVTAQRFVAVAFSPTPSMEGARTALTALRSDVSLPKPALDALAAELSDRYVKKPRVLVAGRDGVQLASLGKLLANNGFSSCAVRSRAELDQQLREGAFALIADASNRELGSPEGVAALRRDPRLAALPILLLAETADPLVVSRGIEAGADDVFPAPLNETLVGAKLKRMAQTRAGAPS